jgi:hypothetical protein
LNEYTAGPRRHGDGGHLKKKPGGDRKMKSDVIIVSNRGKGMDAALALTDSVAGQLGLAGRDALFDTLEMMIKPERS